MTAEEYGQLLASQWETRWEALHRDDERAESAEAAA